MRQLVCDVPSSKRAEICISEESEDEEEPEPVQSSIKTYEEAIALSSDLLCFLTEKGMEETAYSMSKVISDLQASKCEGKKTQTSLLQYFSHN